jgi:hypothetical protein
MWGGGRPMDVDESASGDYATDRRPLAILNMATPTAKGRIMDTGTLGGFSNTTKEDADDS